MLSSSSSLLYINVLLLALIHSSIQIDDAIANVSKEINELEVSIDESKQNLTSAHHQLAEVVDEMRFAYPEELGNINECMCNNTVMI
ncbi:hypothetical protein KSF78_0008488 [Schistosoma japonicum]|nr:hypothetical protein KSF78_0008488 [Schistosoma japonicum]